MKAFMINSVIRTYLKLSRNAVHVGVPRNDHEDNSIAREQ